MMAALVALVLLTSPAASTAETSAPGLPPRSAERFVFDIPGFEGWTSWIAASEADRIQHVQQVLTELGFYRGAVDGRRSRRLDAAIVAFHKATDRPRDTSWSPIDEVNAERWEPDVPIRPSEPDRVEIDIDRQVLYVFGDDVLRAVLPISSGNGKPYRHPFGYRVSAATTPEGNFTFYRRIDGIRRAPLGTLYRPWYFRGGFAVHGSSSVPPWPASHGCVRVTNWDADFLAETLGIGLPVHVWSTETRPEQSLPRPDATSALFA